MKNPPTSYRLAANDPINPNHYKGGRRFQPADVFEDWFCQEDSDPTLAPLLWQVAKYLSRCGRKGGRALALQDLKKARWYLDRAIARKEKRRVKRL